MSSRGSSEKGIEMRREGITTADVRAEGGQGNGAIQGQFRPEAAELECVRDRAGNRNPIQTEVYPDLKEWELDFLRLVKEMGRFELLDVLERREWPAVWAKLAEVLPYKRRG